jgi:hypothetical protein
MFKRNNFISYNGQPRGSELINEWKYVSIDGIEALTSADYFSEVVGLLSVGDIIHVFFIEDSSVSGGATHYRATTDLCVRVSAGGHVAVLPTAVMCGQCTIGNGGGASSGNIAMLVSSTIEDAYCVLSGGVDSDGDTNTVAVKNGSTVLYSATVTDSTADGEILAMAKNGSASAALFTADSFSVANSGEATQAHGTVTVVINASPAA